MIIGYNLFFKNNKDETKYSNKHKVTPEEKAEFIMIAQKYGISLSEWVYSILSMNKNGYEKVGKKRMDDNESIMPLKKI